MRKVLENVPEIVDYLQIQTYRFHESVMDNPREQNFLRKMKYAVLSVPRLILNKRIKGKIESIGSMGGNITLKGNQTPVHAVLPPTIIGRFHYPTAGMEEFKRVQMLRKESTWYNTILNGTFEDEFKKKYVWDTRTVQKGIEDRKVLYIEDMVHLIQKATKSKNII